MEKLSKNGIGCLTVLLLVIYFKPLDGLGQILNDPEWTQHSTVEGVDFHYKISNCNDQSTVYLMITNTTGNKVKVSWDEEFWTNQFYIQENPEGSKELDIAPNQTVFSNCEQTGAIQCVIPIGKIVSISDDSFMQFNYKNIQVAQIL